MSSYTPPLSTPVESGSPPLTVKTLSGSPALSLLWDADDIAGLNDGGAIASWPTDVDAAAGVALVQAAGSAKPSLKVAAAVPWFNGHAAARFDGGDFLTGTPLVGATSALTLFAVCYMKPEQIDAWLMRLSGAGVAMDLAVSGRCWAGGYATNPATAGVWQDNGGLFMVVMIYDGATQQLWVNGRLVHYVAEVATPTLSSGIVVGAQTNGPANAMQGDITLLGAYKTGLSPRQRDELHRALALSYNLALESPSGANADGPAVPNIVIEGDSLSNTGWTATVSNAIAQPKRFANVATAGETLAQMVTQAATQVDPYLHPDSQANVLSIWATTNDLVAGTAVTPAITAYVAYCQARRALGWRVVAWTMLPRTGGGGTFEADRQTFNTYLRANHAAFSDALVDVAADTSIGDPGDNLDTTYYESDAVHLKTAASISIVAPLLLAAVNTLGVH